MGKIWCDNGDCVWQVDSTCNHNSPYIGDTGQCKTFQAEPAKSKQNRRRKGRRKDDKQD